jgi:hypothetical protein
LVLVQGISLHPKSPSRFRGKGCFDVV